MYELLLENLCRHLFVIKMYLGKAKKNELTPLRSLKLRSCMDNKGCIVVMILGPSQRRLK